MLMNKSHIALLRSNYESACNAYLKAFCQKHGFSEAYWVADRVGEIADCNETYTFEMSTIRIDIDEDAPEEQLLEWHSYTEEAGLFNLTTPNFHHWLHGCPRSSPEELQKLRDMRQEFEDKINEINKHNSF